jgi:hypothetical protein
VLKCRLTIQQLSHPLRSDAANTNNAAIHAREARVALSEKVALRVLFPAVVSAHKKLMDIGDADSMKSVTELLQVLSASIRYPVRVNALLNPL